MRSKYKQVKDLDEVSFRRLTGVKRGTFSQMLLILKGAKKKLKIQGGRENKLSLANQLLLCLEYLREYRTYFHIGQSYGVSESTAWRISRWVEDTLIKSREFSLPGKKALAKNDEELEVILIDASESPVERPKKKEKQKPQKRAEALLFRQEEAPHDEVASSGGQEVSTGDLH